MNITRLPSGTWRARVYIGKVNGVSKYQPFTGDTRKEAEMLAMEFQIEFKKDPVKALMKYGVEPSEAPVEAPKISYEEMTVGQAIDAYIDNLDGVASATTIRRYRKDRIKFFGQIMDIQLKDLQQPVIQTAVSSESKRYAPKSIHCAHGLLSAALSMYKPDFVLKTNLPPIPEPDLHIPEEADVKRLLQKIEGKWLEVAVLLGACAGMRRSEICGLKFSDINLEKNTVQVRRTVVKDENGKWVVQERTKTVKSKREIELPGFIIAKMWNQPRESEFVVPVKPDTVSKEFIDTRNALGLKCRFHDLRHYNASIMLALNVPDKYAMERMGYSTPATLKKVYQHTMAGKRAEVNSMINSHMNDMFITGQSTSEKRESA